MLNQTILVGRLVKNVEVKDTETGKKYSNITLAVPRSYKNMEGKYETDFIDCTLWQGIAENAEEYCQKGDLLGLKGRIQTSNYEDKEGKRQYVTQVVAEKITFLSSSKNKEEY